MSGALHSVRVVPVFFLVLVAAVLADIGFGHCSDAAHVNLSASWSQQVGVGDTNPDNSGAEFCAALCATAGAATPVHDSTVAVETLLETAHPAPPAVAIPQHESPTAPSRLGLLGILRI